MDACEFLLREFRRIGVDLSSDFIITLLMTCRRLERKTHQLPLGIKHYKVREQTTFSYTSMIYQYDSADECWKPIAQNGDSAPTPRQHATLNRDNLNNCLWLCGGFDGSSIGTVWKFDCANNTWYQVSSLIGGDDGKRLYGHRTRIYNNKLYIFGGIETNVDGDLYNDVIYVFDIANEEWSYIVPANRPPGRAFHSTIIHANFLYVYGGVGTSGLLSDFWKFNLSSNEWSSITTNISPGKVAYTNMGYLFSSKIFMPYKQYLWIYDASDNEWSQHKVSPIYISRIHNYIASIDNNPCIMGGTDEFGNLLTDMWLYDGTSWSRKEMKEEAEEGDLIPFYTIYGANDREYLFGGQLVKKFNEFTLPRPPGVVLALFYNGQEIQNYTVGGSSITIHDMLIDYSDEFTVLYKKS